MGTQTKNYRSYFPRRWKKLGKGFFPRAPRKEHHPSDTLILAHWDLSDFWCTGLYDKKCVVLATKSVVICSSSHGKQMHLTSLQLRTPIYGMTIKDWKGKRQTGRRDLLYIYLTIELYPEYKSNSPTSIIKRQITQL